MKINIIGSGISGLAAAYYLSRQGHQVTVFESASDVGGLSGYFQVGGTTMEKYYHHIFAGHSALIELINELGIGSKLVFKEVKMGFFYQGRVYPFVTARDLMSFGPLRLADRLRLGLSSLLMMNLKDWRKMETRSAIEWLRIYSGSEACRIVWTPLLKMKYGDNYDRISAAWLWSRMVDRKGNGKAGRKEMLGYIKGGYKELFDALVREIKARSGQIYTGITIDRIHAKEGRATGFSSGKAFYGADVMLATVPIPVLIPMVSLHQEFKDSLNSIAFQGSTCVILKLKKALSRYYWISVSDPQSPFVGVIEHTNLMPPEDYEDRHFVYLTRYSASGDEIFTKPNSEIYTDFGRQLKRMFPEFQESDVEEYWVFQDRFSQPVFNTNYSKIKPPHTTEIENLYLLNTAQFYPESRCLNTSIAKASLIANEIISDGHN